MRIVTWNCNGAFRKKFDAITKYDADIYVIQECEDPEKSNDVNYRAWAGNFLWTGENKHKGLGIFARPGIQIADLQWETDGLKSFIACNVNDEFNLVAVWTKRNNSITYRYIGQFWKYLQINKHNMSGCLIVGDFNSNKIWDEPWRIWNHSDVVKELAEIDIISFYHKHYNFLQGEEQHPTFFLQKNLNKPYHIDYIFAPKEIANKITNFEIGQRDEWLLKSDHLPVLCDF